MHHLRPTLVKPALRVAAESMPGTGMWPVWKCSPDQLPWLDNVWLWITFLGHSKVFPSPPMAYYLLTRWASWWHASASSPSGSTSSSSGFFLRQVLLVGQSLGRITARLQPRFHLFPSSYETGRQPFHTVLPARNSPLVHNDSYLFPGGHLDPQSLGEGDT